MTGAASPRRRARLIGILLAAAAVIVPASARADVVWLCHPGMAADPCEIPLDTTVTAPDGTTSVQTPDRAPAARRPVDCFYVYPTVSNQPRLNATKARDPELESIANYQAARFSQHCRMFAPIYRQITLAGIPGAALGGGEGSPTQIAYGDVLEAWRSYLANDNGGRGVVLLSHSQGTLMLRQLIRTEIERHPEQQRLLAGGILMGLNVTVPNGSTTGGDFATTPICTQPGEARCVVAYSTYASDPNAASFFGHDETDVGGLAFGFPRGPDFHVACTDPGPLSGLAEPAGVTVPSEPFAPGPINAGIAVTNGGPPPSAPTTWVTPADRFAGACRTIGGADVYRYDPVGAQSRRPNEFPPTWGTHLVDMNLGLERLTAIAGRQARGWLADELVIDAVRRNRKTGRARVTVRVPGAGTIAVRRTRRVKRSRRRTTAPTTVTLRVAPRAAARRALRRRRSVAVTARVVYRSTQGSVRRAQRVRLRRR